MDDIALMKVVDSIKNLPDGLGGILFCEFPLLTDSIKQLPAGSKLRHNIVFVLGPRQKCPWSGGMVRTLDSNQSWNLTIWGCFRRCSISNSS